MGANQIIHSAITIAIENGLEFLGYIKTGVLEQQAMESIGANFLTRFSLLAPVYV